MVEQLSPEAEKMLPQTITVVRDLYAGDILAEALGEEGLRDELWTNRAGRFPPFEKRIKEFRQMLKDALETENRNEGPIFLVMSTFFSEVKDPTAQQLLTDLLFARTMRSPGFMDYTVDKTSEAAAMAQELGSSEGVEGEIITNIRLDDVVKSILIGQLKLTRQSY